MAVQREQPYCGQNFLVDLGDGQGDGADGGFSDVSGLETWVEIVEYRDGSDRDASPSKLTGLNKVSDVTLKRGLVGSLRLYRWFDQVRNGDSGALRTVTITLLAEDRTAAMTWKLLRARPVRYAAGPFDATSSQVAVEALTLAYERLEME